MSKRKSVLPNLRNTSRRSSASAGSRNMISPIKPRMRNNLSSNKVNHTAQKRRSRTNPKIKPMLSMAPKLNFKKVSGRKQRGEKLGSSGNTSMRTMPSGSDLDVENHI